MEKRDSKDVILHAAVRVFAEKGYKAATTRDICGLAGVNINAVSYYFNGKENLYKAVLEYMFEAADKFRPAEETIRAVETSPEGLLHLYVHTFARVLLSIEDELDAHFAALFGKEVANPSPFLDEMVDRFIAPGENQLHNIISRIVGDNIPRDVIRDCACSINSQIYYYAFAWPIFIRTYPNQPDMNKHIDYLATHITRFSLGGLTAIKKTFQNNPI